MLIKKSLVKLASPTVGLVAVVLLSACVSAPDRFRVNELYQVHRQNTDDGVRGVISMSRCSAGPVEVNLPLHYFHSEEYLPFGCANQINLMMMVDKKRDLLVGREMGEALYDPVNDAAELYLNSQSGQ